MKKFTVKSHKWLTVVILLCLSSIMFLIIVIPKFSQVGHADTGWPIIVSKEADAFVTEGLNYAIELYGKPKIPVNKVTLRLAGSAVTRIDDPTKGFFTIYLSRRPDEYSFHGQLGHEIGHLLNGRLLDCYAEGLSSVFAEKLVKRKGLDWSRWVQYFEEGKDTFALFYGLTYFMMREIEQIVGSEVMRGFLNYAVDQPGSQYWMLINMKDWVASLPESKQSQVKIVINKFFPKITQAMSIYPYMSCRNIVP